MRYIIFILFVSVSLVGFSQTTSENYVHSITPHTQVQTDASLDNLDPFDMTQSITYYDGLGRPIQSIAKHAGGNGEDIITPMVYDSFGRQSLDYLPYARSSSSLNFMDTDALIFNLEAQYLAKFPNDLDPTAPNPYSEKVLENSPLSRVLEQAAPGEAWKNHLVENTANSDPERTIRFQYQANTLNPEGASSLSDSEGNYYDNVKQFSVEHPNNQLQSIELVFGGYYPNGELYKTITKDENFVQIYEEECIDNSPLCSNIPIRTVDNTTEEYKDKNGRVVLKRTYNNSEPHDTYYVYDDFGNLTFVLSPEGSEAIVSSLGVINSSILDKFCYQYIYDHRNRLVEKKIPGKGWEYIIYDVIDRPVLTQDPNLRAQNQWLFTKYDAFNRVVYTGMLTLNSATSRSTLQNLIVSGINSGIYRLHEERTKKPTYISSDTGTELFYTNKAYPANLQNILVYTINYYDNHSNINLPSALAYQNSFGQPLAASNRSLATVNRVRTLTNDKWTNNAVYYDDKGRTIFTASENNYLDTQDWVKSNLDFLGNVSETETNHSKTGQTTIITNDLFVYDHAFRVKKHFQTINGQDTEVIANNNYDEHGQLVNKGVGGSETNALQDVDYSYNIRGWLKQINDLNNLGSDLFAFKLNYNTTETVTSATDQPEALFNGNISETLWQTAYDDAANIDRRGYYYLYDNLNRITKAVYQRKGSSMQNGRFNLNKVEYDKNGNILKLNRTGKDDNGNYLSTIDKLVYTYNGNQLTDVKENENHNYGFIDAGNEQNGDYIYDANGNLIVDRNKDITNISYNHLNLPTVVSFAGTSISYVYDATGIKLEKQVNNGGQPTVFTRYAGNYIYKQDASSGEQLQFFNQPEGYVEPGIKNTFNYVYQYKDHLGNIRLSYNDSNNNGSINPSTEIREENNYYPFGLKHKGYNNVINGTDHNYGFGGKEEQAELGLAWIDITARNYDPAIGRWMNIDPLAEQMRRHSPYNYAFDNPIFFMDPDGRAPKGFGLLDWSAHSQWEKSAAAKEESTKKNDGDPNPILAWVRAIFSKLTTSLESGGQATEEEIEQKQKDDISNAMTETLKAVDESTSLSAEVSVTMKNNIGGESHTFGYGGEWTLLGGFKKTQDGFISLKFPVTEEASLKLGKNSLSIGASKNTPLFGGSINLGRDINGDYNVDASGRITILQAKSKTTINSNGEVTSSTLSLGLGARDVRQFGNLTFTTKFGLHVNFKSDKK